MQSLAYQTADRRDDTEQFEELYRSTYQDVLAYCRRRVQMDDVEDVVSATYVVAWRRLDDALVADSPIAWLIGVASRSIGNHHRRSRRVAALRTKLRSAPASRAVTLDEEVEARDDMRRTLAAINCLNPRDQELIRLAVFGSLSHREIGEVVGMSPAAVRRRLYRVRLQLRRVLKTDKTYPS